MKLLVSIILLCIAINSFGQNGIKFEIEKLSKPEKLLRLSSKSDIYKGLILSEANLSKWEIEHNGIDFNYGIIAQSEAPDSLIGCGYNSFFFGMYQAYAEHRPFVLSPDMIWLLISQGFARHVNANAEELRKHFADFSGKLTLVVESDSDLITSSQEWEEIFPKLTAQIADHTGKELMDVLTCNFSTSTPVEKIASEITILEAMKPYFEYVVMRIVCGIPEITLQGTTEDWQKVYNKTKYLGKYNLNWWTSELEPLLKEFVKASKGDINKKFWRNMFKYHSQKQYGAPKIIDGWIVKFFPYDKEGKRNNLKQLNGYESLPDEIVKVDLKYLEVEGGLSKETLLELWSGFIGLKQDPVDFTLTPQIGWMIKKKDTDEQGTLQKLELENIPSSGQWRNGIDLKIIEVPVILKKLSEIYTLNLHFKNDVFIPDWLKEIRIGKLVIEGAITQAEKFKIKNWFPDTELIINGKQYNKGNNGWITVLGNKIPEEVLKLDKIWVLEIWNNEFDGETLIIPDELKNIEIENLYIENKTSSVNIEKIMQLLPETRIYMHGRKIK